MNLRKIADMMTLTCLCPLSTNPKANTDRLMTVSETPMSYAYPKSSVILVTCGEKMTDAIEKAANTTPTYSGAICLLSNTGGRKGAAKA